MRLFLTAATDILCGSYSNEVNFHVAFSLSRNVKKLIRQCQRGRAYSKSSPRDVTCNYAEQKQSQTLIWLHISCLKLFQLQFYTNDLYSDSVKDGLHRFAVELADPLTKLIYASYTVLD